MFFPRTRTSKENKGLKIDGFVVFRYRFYLSSNKKALAKFVKCINWQVSSQASQAMDLIYQWAPMDVEDALELLGPSFTDPTLRQYAVDRMREAPDSELQLYLLQLVQALKYEPHPLTKFTEVDRHELHAEAHVLEKIGASHVTTPPTTNQDTQGKRTSVFLLYVLMLSKSCILIIDLDSDTIKA